MRNTAGTNRIAPLSVSPTMMHRIEYSAVTPIPPVVTLDSSSNTTASISWTDINNKCVPISSYRIYLNGQLYITVPNQITSYTLNVLTGENNIYVTSVSTNIESSPSNILNLTITGYIGPSDPYN
jgi:hypothetical protein